MKKLEYYPGQSLAYAEYGDPNGRPILVQHGMIASIRPSPLFDRLIARGARVICMARPGYGDASPYPMKSIGEWGQMTACLLGTLGLAHLDVLGISSGAPYAYAIGYHCAARVGQVYILSGTPALYAPAIQALWPYPIDPTACLEDLQRLAHALFFAHLTEAETDQDDIRDSLANDCFGIALDLQLRVRDWGFRLENVQVPVVMRHSRADESVPFTAAEQTAGLLPNCLFQAREEDPHFSPAVLDEFILTIIENQN